MIEKNATVLLNGEEKYAKIGTLLSDLVSAEKPCGGHGKCGKCKAYITGCVTSITQSEKKLLTVKEMQSGIRLLCMTRVMGNCEVRTNSRANAMRVLTEGARRVPYAELGHYGVALDIGTTTLAAALYAPDGRVRSTIGAQNPQSVYGQDVISRMEAAREHASELATLIRGAIAGMLRVLAHEANISTDAIASLVITGNTTMLYLLTETETEPLSHAPFTLTRPFGETLRAQDLKIDRLAPACEIYLAPCISAFIGADTVCALIASGIMEKQETAMLADIGTNGELALHHGENLYVASTAAGPAFEGIGIRMGMRGELGAIDRVTLEGEQLKCRVIGEVAPLGICGSGLIDAVRALLERGDIDESGYMAADETTLSSPVVLTARDVRMVQLAKSAISAGLSTLITTANITPEDVRTLYIAGGFGSYLNLDSASRIGLLPCLLAKRACVIGNAALDGAGMLLLQPTARSAAEKMARQVHLVDLSSSSLFSTLYTSGMLFPEK